MADRLNDVLGEALKELSANDTIENQNQNTADTALATGNNTPATDNNNGEEEHLQEPQPQTTSAKESQNPTVDGLEEATAALAEAKAQNARLTQQNAQLTQQIQQQQSQAIQQQSQTQQVALEDIAENKPKINLDFAELMYLNDEDRAKKIGEFMQSLQKSTRESVLAEFEPVIADFKKRQSSAEDEAVFTSISGSGKFPDFREREGEIRNVISNTPELQNMSPEQKYTLAYLISKGVQSMNAASKPRSTEDILNEVTGNDEVMRALETRRAKQISNANNDVPVLSAAQAGTANVPATPDKSPKNLREAFEQSKLFLGLG